MERFLCSAAATDRGEPALGTASRIDRWVLVEAPGPWGPRALPQSRGLDDAHLLALQQTARTAHARTLLIRRPGPVRALAARQVFLADCRPGRERLLGRQVADADLADLVLPFEGPADGWEPQPTWVGACTHGAHDACCAIRGRPVAAALAAAYPAEVWEVSHVGGDRFAANVLVLPGGHYLGQLPAGEAVAAVRRLLAGERPDPWYRGRSCWSMPAQAATSFAATELGRPRLDALTPTAVRRVADHRWDVDIAVADAAPVTVRVEQRQGPDTSLLTCHAPDEHPVPRWQLLWLRPA